MWRSIIICAIFAVNMSSVRAKSQIVGHTSSTRLSHFQSIVSTSPIPQHHSPQSSSSSTAWAQQQIVGTPGARDRKPNIILILTDDQDVELGSLNFMPKTRSVLREQGAEFRHAYVTTPMCCPSRSSLLTGMYVHNHNVYTNNENCSSTEWQSRHETRTFATYLSNAGYRTGFFGKYLNKYNGSYIPPGWREWGGLIMNSKYYNYSINMNGNKIKKGFDYHKDYYPDLITNDSIAFLHQSKKSNQNKPIMLTMSFPAPHGPEDAAPQYSNMFFNVSSHHTPAYDYAPNPDKQWILQVTQKMKGIHRNFTNLLMTKRLQTLQSVDHAVERVVRELEKLDELNNTYIIYTSDHGYHLGQFGLIKGKSFPFEFDIRVPFLIRGPGIEAGRYIDDVIINLDLAPTILDMAGVEIQPHMDGKSFLPLLLKSKHRKNIRWRDTFLVESSGRRDSASRSKSHNYLTELNNSTNVFNTSRSATVLKHMVSQRFPERLDEMINSSSSHPEVESEEDISEHDLEEFSGSGEHAGIHIDDEPYNSHHNHFDHLYPADESSLRNGGSDIDSFNRLTARPLSAGHYSTKLHHLERECLSDQRQLPCKIGQKWYCSQEMGRWRRHKCKVYTNYLNARHESAPALKRCACITGNGIVYRTLYEFGADVQQLGQFCDCQSDHAMMGRSHSAEKQRELDERRRLRDERLRKKQRKTRKKAQMEECVSEKIHCFRHDNDHWKTVPMWTEGPFCFCMNANNNTYNCIRTINATHNVLYCEFVTGTVTYYNLRIDPFQLTNLVHNLDMREKQFYHEQLKKYMTCKGLACRTDNGHRSRQNIITEDLYTSQPNRYSDTNRPNPIGHTTRRKHQHYHRRYTAQSHFQPRSSSHSNSN